MAERIVGRGGVLATDASSPPEPLEQFGDAAVRIERFGQFVPRACVVYGPSDSSRAALLRGRRALEASRVRTVWVDARESESLVWSLLHGLEEFVTEEPEPASRSSERGTPAGFTFTEASNRLVDGTRRAAEAVTRDGGAGIALLIDEIQEADSAGLQVLAYAWQDLAGTAWRIGQVRAALFGAGRSNAPARLARAVGISERFDWVPLGDARDE